MGSTGAQAQTWGVLPLSSSPTLLAQVALLLLLTLLCQHFCCGPQHGAVNMYSVGAGLGPSSAVVVAFSLCAVNPVAMLGSTLSLNHTVPGISSAGDILVSNIMNAAKPTASLSQPLTVAAAAQSWLLPGHLAATLWQDPVADGMPTQACGACTVTSQVWSSLTHLAKMFERNETRLCDIASAQAPLMV